MKGRGQEDTREEEKEEKRLLMVTNNGVRDRFGEGGASLVRFIKRDLEKMRG